MLWTDDYIDLPYKIDGRDREGVDCWGLVCLVYREQLGIDLPDHANEQRAAQGDWKVIAASMEEDARRWKQVDRPQEFDVVLMRRGPLSCHVGLYLGRGAMLHICDGIDSAIESCNGAKWGKRIVGFYRHA